ncbi:MAG: hypothetical protein IKB56_07890 [Clostridia bacterium]|nr:hypothetical protein [Clostridia bacterium]
MNTLNNSLNLKIKINKTGHRVGRLYTLSNKEEFDNTYWKGRETFFKLNAEGDRAKEAKFVINYMKPYYPRDKHLKNKILQRMGLWEPQKREKSQVEIKLREVYLESVRKRLKNYGEWQSKFVAMKLKEAFPEVENVDDIVDARLGAEITAYTKRMRRLSDKIFLNRFNYFVTLTYDDEKFESEEDFRKAITMTLAHFSNRRGWRYCYCFERGDLNGRLHIHGFFYIPKGEMPGEIAVRRVYRLKDKTLQWLHVNTWFEENYGVNEFSPLDKEIVSLSNVIEYCSDYCFKSGDKVHYSRYLPSELEKTVANSDVYLSYINNVEEFVMDKETVKFIKEDDVVPSYVTTAYIKDSMNRIVDYLNQRKR